jgi:hypothetical protein
VIQVHHALLKPLLFFQVFGFGASIPLKESLLTNFGHLFFEVEKVLLFKSLLDLVIAHVFVLHISYHLLPLDELFITETEIITTFLIFLAAKSLLSGFHSLTLALGKIIFVVKFDFTTLAFSIVSHNDRVEHF